MRWSVVFTVLYFLSACSTLSASPSSVLPDDDPNYQQGLYVNNHIDHPMKSFWSFVRMRFLGEDVWHDPDTQKHLIPQTQIDLAVIKTPEASQVTWFGHSTFLIQHRGMNILTDPVFSKRASPLSFAGPKRYTLPAAPVNQLPEIDIVVISHNHYDHLDIAAIQALGNGPIYYVPSNLAVWFIDAGIDPARVKALRWWQSATHRLTQTKITALPSQHWSARGLYDRNLSHWASWLISMEGLTLWFAGDTGYNDKDFVAIGDFIQQLGRDLDLALIPIGAYAPRHFMKPYHVNVEEAVQIHHDTRSKLSLGMHWGTFPLTAEKPMEPYERLNQIRSEGGIKSGTAFQTLKIGETFNLKP